MRTGEKVLLYLQFVIQLMRISLTCSAAPLYQVLMQLAARGTVYGRVSFLEEEESLPCPMLTRVIAICQKGVLLSSHIVDFTSGNNPLISECR